MAVSSNMLELGTRAPDFDLLDVVNNVKVSKEQFVGRPLLVMFICAHCPYVIHVEKEIARVANDYKERIAFVAISANDIIAYPSDSPENLKAQAIRLGFSFPYLFDSSQAVARAYKAACTPDFFLFDENHKLVYRGRLDDSRPKSETQVSGKDLRVALEAVLDHKIIEKQYPSMGCNIKWRD